MKPEEPGILDYYNYLADGISFPEDKYTQALMRFIDQKDVDFYIRELRNALGISVKDVWGRISKYKELEKKHDKIHHLVCKYKNGKWGMSSRSPDENLAKKYGYYQSKEKLLNYWADLEHRVNSKIKNSDIDFLLKKFDRPLSWRVPLGWYVISGRIIQPTKNFRCFPYFDEDLGKIIIEVSVDATDDDLKAAFKYVGSMQKRLPGYITRHDRRKKNFKERLQMAKDYELYKQMKKNQRKKNRCLRLIQTHNPALEEYGTPEDDKREMARQRKSYHRLKSSKK